MLLWKEGMTAQGFVYLCKICYIGVFSVFLLVNYKRAACFDTDVKPFSTRKRKVKEKKESGQEELELRQSRRCCIFVSL